MISTSADLSRLTEFASRARTTATSAFSIAPGVCLRHHFSRVRAGVVVFSVDKDAGSFQVSVEDESILSVGIIHGWVSDSNCSPEGPHGSQALDIIPRHAIGVECKVQQPWQRFHEMVGFVGAENWQKSMTLDPSVVYSSHLAFSKQACVLPPGMSMSRALIMRARLCLVHTPFTWRSRQFHSRHVKVCLHPRSRAGSCRQSQLICL